MERKGKWLPRKLRRLRAETGLDATQLGALLGLGHSSVAYYETGDRKPRIEHLYLVVRVMQLWSDRDPFIIQAIRSVKKGGEIKQNLADEIRYYKAPEKRRRDLVRP